MSEMWEFEMGLEFQTLTPRIWAKVAPGADYTGMSAEEIYNDLLARHAPLEAINKAIRDQEELDRGSTATD